MGNALPFTSGRGQPRPGAGEERGADQREAGGVAPDKGGSSRPDLTALRRHDPEVLASVVTENAPVLYRVARAWGVSEADADDLVQETFVTFLSGLDRFEGRSQLRTWLCGILRHKIHAYRRSRHFEPLSGDPGTHAPNPVAAAEAGEAIRHCLAHLPERQRGAFRLEQLESAPRAESSRRLGVTSSHFAVLLHRAYAMLRDCLERAGWGRSSP